MASLAAGKASLRGKDGALYSLVSDPGVALHARTEGVASKLQARRRRLLFTTRAHVAPRTLTGTLPRLTCDANRIGPDGASHDVADATCGAGALGASPARTESHHRLNVSVDAASLGAHGPFGPSFDGSEIPRSGRHDQSNPLLDVPSEYATRVRAGTPEAHGGACRVGVRVRLTRTSRTAKVPCSEAKIGECLK